MVPDDAQFQEKLDATVRGLRRFGLLFFVVSTAFVAFLVYSACDLSVPFRINGVESHDISERVRAAAFSVLLPLFASVFAFCPRAVLEKLLRRQFAEIEKMKRRLGLTK